MAAIAKQGGVKNIFLKKEQKREKLSRYFDNSGCAVILLEMNSWGVGMKQMAHRSRYRHRYFEYGLLCRVVVKNIIQSLKGENWGWKVEWIG